eukprot:CAMPEP_0202104978 /NCGR_PEP_ID=MMETSP0965-20130614/5771_1 /ASSEMBLY_ACC=CAM_ASM_000507 /TAXON_ID=4773 /ORGANISM="Schizochytrium aggregatum, Strain ATCC28209" /LENGTH=550 /DNA_ID=CAMNT_0048673853 /DNA_START=1 /DNA_END=1650 /DNA_ORIENTATION=+
MARRQTAFDSMGMRVGLRLQHLGESARPGQPGRAAAPAAIRPILTLEAHELDILDRALLDQPRWHAAEDAASHEFRARSSKTRAVKALEFGQPGSRSLLAMATDRAAIIRANHRATFQVASRTEVRDAAGPDRTDLRRGRPVIASTLDLSKSQDEYAARGPPHDEAARIQLALLESELARRDHLPTDELALEEEEDAEDEGSAGGAYRPGRQSGVMYASSNGQRNAGAPGEGLATARKVSERNRTKLLLGDAPPESLEDWGSVPENYRLKADATGRFFLYQPSGGWGNQRLILRWAVILANAMNRTLVLPPIAGHTSMYENFNKKQAHQVLHMGQVLDLDTLNSVVYRGVKVHVGDMESYQHGILQHLKWRMHERNSAISFISERTVMARWAKEDADVVFWRKGSMWRCCATHQLMYYHHINYAIDFSAHLKLAALRAIAPFGPRFNALHFRRGDSHHMERRTVKGYVKFHHLKMHRFDRSVPLYIATDESDRSFFDAFLSPEVGFSSLVFASDLIEAELAPILDAAAPELRGTLIGFVEQIICVAAERW